MCCGSGDGYAIRPQIFVPTRSNLLPLGSASVVVLNRCVLNSLKMHQIQFRLRLRLSSSWIATCNSELALRE